MSATRPETQGRLRGRRVLVVGASRGIGRAIGLRAHGEGAAVTFAARDAGRLRDAVAGCGDDAVAVPCDVRDPDQCRAVVSRATEAMGGLDALVYAAGVTRFVELAGATAEDWRQVLETNVVGAGLVTTAAMGHLRASSGHAVYLSSEAAAYRPDAWRGIGLYLASKAALESLARSVQVEAPDVAVTTYVVGSTLSEIGSDDPEAMAGFVSEWYERGYLRDRILEPEVHAKAVVDILAGGAWIETVSVRARRA